MNIVQENTDAHIADRRLASWANAERLVELTEALDDVETAVTPRQERIGTMNGDLRRDDTTRKKIWPA